MLSYIKKPPIYIGTIIIAGLIATYVLTLGSGLALGEVVTVSRGDITQEVFITGTVRSARNVSLSFDRGGTLKSLPFLVGAIVEEGTVIASLQNDSEYASVAERKALVALSESNLAEILKGSRAEEIQLKEAEARKAEVSLQNSNSKTFSVVSDAYSAAEESLNRYADPFFSDDNTFSPRLTYRTGTQEAFDAEQKRLSAGISVNSLRATLQSDDPTSPSSLEETLKELRVVQDMFITLGLTLRDDSTLDQTTLADYRSRVTSARSALTTAISSVQNQQNSLRDAEAEFERAKSALALSRAKATPETIAGAEHELEQARANLLGANAVLAKTLLRAPFRGIISSKHAEVGETIQTGQGIMDFFGTDGFIIEANVPEADVTKLNKGMGAEVTLDAYGDEGIFPAHVSLIESASTLIDGVPTYKTTFVFEKQEPNLRSGLTANVTMKMVTKKGVLIIPARAVIAEGASFVVQRMRADQTIEKVEVKTGARSGSREVEIVEGLNEGERVIIPQARD